MSEVQSRPSAPRGRGSARGGRGGFSTRGGGRTAARSAGTNGTTQHDTESSLPTLEDEGEISELRKLYGEHIVNIKSIMSDWTDVDILYALRETDGNPDETVTRILEGTISKWNEVSKPVKTKAKNDTFTTTTADSGAAGGLRNARGGRVEGGRGRGRATERGGRGGGRGKSIHPSTNGPRVKENQPLSVPTEESTEWDTSKPTTESNEWTDSTPAESTPAPAAVEPTPAAAPAKSSPDAPKTWASMLRQSTTPKPASKPKEAPVSPPAEPVPVIEPLPPVPAEPEVVPEPEIAAPVEEQEEPVPEPVQEQQPPVAIPVIQPVIPVVPAVPAVVVPEVALAPSKDALTDENLDRVPDTSEPPATETTRSEAADSWDPRAVGSATATPLSASQQQHQAERTPSSGFAATATKATARTPAFPRRVLDQLEAVRMPGNRDQVDRAAVQFGAFSLNGGIEDDIDGDREEPETRPQPPQDSPVAQPRASLPPVQPPAAPQESLPTPTQKPASQVPTGPAGMTPHTNPAAAPAAAASAITPAAAPTPQPAAQPNQQYGRFGQQTAPQEHSSFPPSKPFDSFGQQQPAAASTQSQFEGSFQGQSQPAAQSQNQQQAFSSAPNDYPSYYTSGDQRGFYGGYNYNQQQSSQDGPTSQAQRFGGYGATQADNLSQYPQSGAQHGQSRFGSGSAPSAETPVTTAPATSAASALPQAGQTSQAQHGQQPQPDQYPYHPYSNSPYYGGYMGGYGQYGQGGYAPYAKGNVGYQPNQYGLASQGPYGYSNPSAGFGQSALHRETGAAAAAGGAAGLGDYGRAGSQSAQQQSGFGAMHDAFGRGGSGYQSQAASFNAPGAQPGAGPSAVDDIKSFGDAKGAAGPSPSLGVAARPGSAANNGPSQSGLPPPQSGQQTNLGGMGQYGYPGHMQQGHGLHGSHTAAGGYGMSATGGQSQQSSYGGYGNQGFGGGYYGGNSQPRGWGNNYHH